MFGQPRALAIAASLLGVMGLIPGMPNLPFLMMAALCGGGAWMLHKRACSSRLKKKWPRPRLLQLRRRRASESKGAHVG